MRRSLHRQTLRLHKIETSHVFTVARYMHVTERLACSAQTCNALHPPPMTALKGLDTQVVHV